MAENTVKLTCSDCGGTMDIDADKKVLLCPFCGSKKIILESDEVKIAKIQADADVEKAKIERDMKIIDRENEKNADKEDNLTILMLFILVFGIALIFKFLMM